MSRTADSSSSGRLGDVCVLGLGSTGEAVARYCLGLVGSRVDSVTVWGGGASVESDLSRALSEAGARVRLGTDEVAGSYDLCVASPGISELSGFFAAARSCSGEIVGEPEFAWRESPDRWVGITGTNGKTTTTTLVRDLLRAGGLDAEAVGNIGRLAIAEVSERREGEWLVAELSSFQLATASRLHPRVGVLLNVTPDHLAWHGTLENYAAAKRRLFANLSGRDLAVVSVDDGPCRAVADDLARRGVRVCRLSVGPFSDSLEPDVAYVSGGGRLVVRLDGRDHPLCTVEELPIKGSHNVENALAASAAALEVGCGLDAVRGGLLAFAPLEHRIEPCGESRGVRFVNDSKATNTDATLKALTAFPEGHVVLMLGGHDKGTDLADLSAEVRRTCKAAVCFGDARERLSSSLEGAPIPVVGAEHLADALEQACRLASSGDVVLLSPACSSFDEFSGFEERGRAFKRLVAQAISDGRA